MRNNIKISIASNLAGFAFPLLIGVVCIPIIIQQMGLIRFGFLSVGWTIIGYFSVFDLGLGRALTQAISSRLGAGEVDQIFSLTRKVLVAMLILSIVGGLVLLGISSSLITYVFRPPVEMEHEGRLTLYLLASGIPAVVIYSGLKGILEAFGEFHLSAMSRAILGIWTFTSPLLLFMWSVSLVGVVGILVVGRYVITALMISLVVRLYRRKGLMRYCSESSISQVITFGGWMTVSNIISPVMVYMDRFFVSSISGLSTVAYYTTPYDLVSRLSFIPEAVFSVLFPVMARHHAAGGREMMRLYFRSLAALGCVMLVISLCIISVSPEFLQVWLNADFARNSYLIMDILITGLFVNVLARPAYNLLQAIGRSDITAKIHLLELPVYIYVLVLALKEMGAVGAAWAWLMRAFLDFMLLTMVVHRIERRIGSGVAVVASGAATLLVLLIPAFIDDLLVRVAYSLLICFIFMAIGTMYFRREHGKSLLTVALREGRSKDS